MSRILRFAVAGAMLTTLLIPAGAMAAVPSNDLPSGATALPSALPAQISQDTTEATVGGDDVGCGAGGADQATVWYTYVPEGDARVLIDAGTSSYAVGVNVFADVPDGEHLIWCSEGSVLVDLVGDTTYYIMFADIDGETNGGTLSASLELGPPAIGIELLVDPNGSATKSGEATIRGTATCTAPAEFAEVGVTVRQSVGRFTIHGSSFASIDCGPEPTAWAITVAGDNGTFGKGRAAVEVNGFACDASSCSEFAVTESVRLGK